MNRCVLVLPFYGERWPNYFPLWLASVRGRALDVLLVTDMVTDNLDLPENVCVVNCSLVDLRQLAERKLKARVALDNVRKLCDLKPFYGKVFEDYIEKYSYWAFGDADLVYGAALDALVDRIVASGCDVWSNRRHWISGGFCVVRNSALGRNLAFRARNWREVLENPDCLLFDELGCNEFERLERGEVTVQICAAKIDSFSGVVWCSEDLKVVHEDIICEDSLDDAEVVMDDGVLTLRRRGCSSAAEIPIFHYINAKKHRSFTIPVRLSAAPYLISATGVQSLLHGRVRRSVVSWSRMIRGGVGYGKYRLMRFVKHRVGLLKG